MGDKPSKKSAKVAKNSTKKSTRSTNRRAASPKKAGPGSAGDWRADMLQRVRTLIKQADPEITEEVKWRKPSNPAGVPVWSHDGMICTGETYKNAVKLTFARGAALEDPASLFNSGFDGNVRRAIDIHEGDEIDERAFKDLIRAAVALNISSKET